ncbi:murein transglycosylase A [Lichenicoccus roseus]|uniref:peptidoglycan lytic exotransglycosylase n=1 Tax=Lichenicoccus roseus TaxID=2683649 RepID=A0A5R9J7W5_9PROT|nr:murein transglycosylase A [Lichenicoccus roseus]TLU73672.1 murein transglycosylase [Lichenicoccus roseus]
MRAAPLLAGLAGCAAQPSGPPALSLRPVGYDTLTGWSSDQVATVLPALLDQCHRLALLPPDTALGGAGAAAAEGGKAGDWAGFCQAIQSVPAGDAASLRRVIALWLQPYAVGDAGREDALFTGYFEPEFHGSLTRDATYRVPVYRRPPDLLTVHDAQGAAVTGRVQDGHVVPYFTRAQIDHGALEGRGLEILWLADPVDLFFLQVQGSGRVRLPGGQIVRLGYAGRNGARYTPLGRLLLERGDLPADGISMQTIRAWLGAHPEQAQSVMEADANYVFFRVMGDLRPDQGPPGALGLDLSPLRSAAIDRSFVPLGSLLWIDSTTPSGTKLQRLMLAQDLGTDITGPARADVFFGWGEEAAQQAGAMHASGRLIILLPRPLATPAAAGPATRATARAGNT